MANKESVKNIDRNFDVYSSRLKKNIYGSLKGKIRLKILLNDLEMFLDSDRAPLKVLDAGCGSAQCSVMLALKGHQVTLCDISSVMIEDAEETFKKNNIKASEFITESVQDHSGKHQSEYDLILCHAVLEWTADPKGLLYSLQHMLKPGGYLSLMYFNRNGAILKSVVRGNFYPKDRGFQFGQTKSLTPTRPLYPQEVDQWAAELGLTIMEKSGVRVFYDYCEKSIRDQSNEEQVLNCELSFSKTEPFMSSARYIHMLYRN